jgi:hypothetical protein
MNIIKNSTYLAFCLLVSISCKKEELIIPVNSALYDVTVTGMWSENTHPVDFPSNAHFSSLVGMIHNEKTSLFTIGELASAGIQEMAERGRTDKLDKEIDEMILGGNVYARINGTGISTGTGSGTASFQVTGAHYSVSIVSMLAPSPDWFIAIHDLSMKRNGVFITDTVLDLNVYDAGTDSGVSFASSNDVTSPPQNISKFVMAPLGNGISIKPVIAKIRFVLRK